MAARRRNLTDDAVVRDMLVTILIQERILGWIGQRMRAAAAAGRPPGPEGSIAKLANSILAKASSNAGMHIHGPASQAWDPAADGATAPSADFLQAPMTAIAGGTSEIQRNTIAERVLGLPKEPAIDQGIPYREVRKNRPHSER
jgi:alkylation response protein AidB-like acyl-CoA dehydrogenase